jgi:alkyldihydroxyacetonephosphate synthase
LSLCRRLSLAIPDLATSDGPSDRIFYARDLWPRHHLAVRAGRIAEHRPAAVAWPSSTEQVARLVRWCGEEGVGVVPFGAGSGVCSGVLPTPDTLVVDLKRLDRWRRLDPDEGTVDVEAGVQGIRLEEDLHARGFTAGHFPSSILCSTVGGWVAARGAGQCSGLYGKIEDMVAALECVDGRGEVATLQRRLCGPQLIPLWVGSEGVLGMITSVKLRLHPHPEHRAFAAFALGTLDAGCETIRQIYQNGLRPAVCRWYDPFDSMLARLGAVRPGGRRTRHAGAAPGMGSAALRHVLRVPGALNRTIEALGSRLLGGSLLVLVFEGPRDDNARQLAEATSIARAQGAELLGPGPAEHWFAHRYSVSYRQAPVFMMGGFSDTMEVAAPWSSLIGLYHAVRRALGRHVLVMAHLSHAYPDGCSIYFTFAGAAADDAACEQLYDRAWNDALDAAVGAGGTLSHHHGIGRSKATKLGAELGVGIDVIAALRTAFDPAGIMNTGNMRPPSSPRRLRARPLPPSPELDAVSQLCTTRATYGLEALERYLEARGLTLGLGPDAPRDPSTTVGAWLSQGAPGGPDPWLDPVDHLVAGYSVELPSGAILELPPGPRRAVGPDLSCLFLGTEGRAGTFRIAHLRARSARSARPLLTSLERNPAPSSSEDAWLARALGAVATV